VKKYRFNEHGEGYRIKKTLQPWRPQFPVIINWIPVGSKVLDVGCGDGVLGEMLIKEKNCNVYGIDLDEIGVREAIRKGVKALVGDADEGLPYPDKSFDVVVCNELLEFVNSPDFVVGELLRVGKKVIIEFPNFGFWFYRLQMLFGRFPSLSLYGHMWWETSQVRFFSLADFNKLPFLRKAMILQRACIDWKNRKVSILSRFAPNLFARSCILEMEKKN
jgi:methionine biosynthesis protein MetW